MLRNSLTDEQGIQVLHIREADQLVDRGIISDIPFKVGVCVAPFEGSNAKHGYVQHIGLAGVNP